jgi:hypothetical protein
MLASRHPAITFLLAAVVAFAVIVGAQALANASAPPIKQLSQTKLIGQAGFAYLGGLRMMGAGLLWGRLDAQFHQYGGLAKIQDRLDLLPSIRLVQLLNPQLEQPYYFTSYILYLRGHMADALSLAREGIANNPSSGLLRANYIQLLFTQDRTGHLPEMIKQAEVGMGPTATYTSIDDEFESYGIFRVVYTLDHNQARVAQIDKILAYLKAQNPSAGQNGQSGGFFGLLNAWAGSATDTSEKGAPSVPVTGTPAAASGSANSTSTK